MSKSSEINTDNIIKPSLDDLSEEHHQIYEEFKKQRDEANEALKKQREEEDLQVSLETSTRGAKATLLRLEKSSSLLFMMSRLNPL